jgi:hypothetical protein
LLLHYAREEGFNRTDVGKYAMESCPCEALKTLTAPDVREVVKLPSGKHGALES